jgi:hypothetical protein
MRNPKFPHIELKIVVASDEGSQPFLLNRVMGLLRKHQIEESYIRTFRAEIAHAADYNAVLAIIGRWINFNDGEYLPHGKWIR